MVKKKLMKSMATRLAIGTTAVDMVDSIGAGVSMIGVEEDSEVGEVTEEAGVVSMTGEDAVAEVVAVDLIEGAGVDLTGEAEVASTVEAAVVTAEAVVVVAVVTETRGVVIEEDLTKVVSMIERVSMEEIILKIRK